MGIEFTKGEVLAADTSMNIECNYHNRYAEKKHSEDIVEFLEMIQHENMNQDHKKILENLEFADRERISIYSNISFSKSDIDKIMSSDEDVMYHEVAKLLFGNDADNIFAKKYHRVWHKIKTDSRGRGSLQSTRLYRNCSQVLYTYNITDSKNHQYSEFNGIVRNDKGINAYKTSVCYNYFRRAKKIVTAISSVKDQIIAILRLQSS